MRRLHGTSIDARDSADAFKMKPRGAADAEPYAFGAPAEACATLLAPSRHGAHNWEGVGLGHALAALDALADRDFGGRRDLDVVVTGHSMGGHGAALLAAVLGDARGLSATAGWLRKEAYGDSNARYVHDAAAHAVEPALRAVLDATLAGSEVDTLATNLCRAPALLRAGDQDQAVPPFYMRRLHRLIASACPEAVSYVELPGKAHWWWDTAYPNDGGAVNDEAQRAFFADAFARDRRPCPAGYVHVCPNVDAVLGACGFRVLQQVAPFRTSTVAVTAGGRLATRNVRRLRLAEAARVDGADLPAGEACFDGGDWRACGASAGRGPGTSGPLRQVVETAFEIVAEEKHLALAVYLANQFAQTGHARAPVALDDASGPGNVVLLGDSAAARDALNRTAAALEIRDGAVDLGGCAFRGPGVAVAALLPLDGRLALLLWGADDGALAALVALLATPTIPPMARQPFSNALPDVVVLDAAAAETGGAAGYVAAGFWDSDWSFARDASWVADCRPLLAGDSEEVCPGA